MMVGIVQAGFSVDVSKNLAKIERIVRGGFREADLIVFPEYSMVNVLKLEPEEVYRLSETINDSRYLNGLSKIASDLGTHILAHFVEKADELPKPLSSSILIEPDGSRVRVYSKIHLFDAYGFRESSYFTPGTSISKQFVLGGAKVRVAMCYDLRFPELFRLYALNDAGTVVVHAGWVRGLMKEETLVFLARARAHENGFWLILSNHFGENYVGRSMIVDPFGVKVLDLGLGEKYVEFEIDLNKVSEARKLIPAIEESRKIWNIRLKHRNN